MCLSLRMPHTGRLENDVKYLLVIGDGMADNPVPELGGKTPLQVAKKPTIDRLAARKDGPCATAPAFAGGQ